MPYAQLIPLVVGISSDCTDPCVCDDDGVVGGTYTSIEGGCALRTAIEVGAIGGIASLNRAGISGTSESSSSSLCMVPIECNDIGNSTATIQAELQSPAWTQPAQYKFRVCDVGELLSDKCDPGPAQVRSNTLAFFTVFVAQVRPVHTTRYVAVERHIHLFDR